MNIIFKDKKFGKACNKKSKLQQLCGRVRADLISRRLAEIYAANDLEELSLLAKPRCHPLKGNRDGQFSVDLDHPYRLLFTIADNPIPKKDDGGIDLKRVTAVKIIGVEDTHE